MLAKGMLLWESACVPLSSGPLSRKTGKRRKNGGFSSWPEQRQRAGPSYLGNRNPRQEQSSPFCWLKAPSGLVHPRTEGTLITNLRRSREEAWDHCQQASSFPPPPISPGDSWAALPGQAERVWQHLMRVQGTEDPSGGQLMTSPKWGAVLSFYLGEVGR